MGLSIILLNESFLFLCLLVFKNHEALFFPPNKAYCIIVFLMCQWGIPCRSVWCICNLCWGVLDTIKTKRIAWMKSLSGQSPRLWYMRNVSLYVAHPKIYGSGQKNNGRKSHLGSTSHHSTIGRPPFRVATVTCCNLHYWLIQRTHSVAALWLWAATGMRIGRFATKKVLVLECSVRWNDRNTKSINRRSVLEMAFKASFI